MARHLPSSGERKSVRLYNRADDPQYFALAGDDDTDARANLWDVWVVLKPSVYTGRDRLESLYSSIYPTTTSLIGPEREPTLDQHGTELDGGFPDIHMPAYSRGLDKWYSQCSRCAEKDWPGVLLGARH